MITLPTMKSCPIAKESQGIIEIEPWILKAMRGAVRDKDEWLVVLLGTKKEKGLHVIVDDIYVPPTQHRTSMHCKPYREDTPSPGEEFPRRILSKIVGSAHSHNSMDAKFSGGDRAVDGV